jgi:hypothetical protein
MVNAGVSQTIGRGEEVVRCEVERGVLTVNLDGTILTVAAGCRRCAAAAQAKSRLLVGWPRMLPGSLTCKNPPI